MIHTPIGPYIYIHLSIPCTLWVLGLQCFFPGVILKNICRWLDESPAFMWITGMLNSTQVSYKLDNKSQKKMCLALVGLQCIEM